jgi:hypothetical protein
LIWLCSGAIHNKEINDIIKYIFNNIDDGFTEYKQYSGKYCVSRSHMFDAHYYNIGSDDFNRYINDHAEFGLKTPDVVDIDISQDASNLISEFMLYTNTILYLSDADRNVIKNILLLLNLTSLRAMITLILNKMLFTEYQCAPLTYYNYILSKLCLEIGEAESYGIFRYSDTILDNIIMNDSLYSLYVPPTYIAKDIIPSYTLKDFFSDKNNLPLDHLFLQTSSAYSSANNPSTNPSTNPESDIPL